MDDENQPSQSTQFGTPLDPARVFRPGRKGTWHLLAHSEYGVVWSRCGIRSLRKDCQSPADPVYVRDLCGTCARAAKEEIGKDPSGEGKAPPG